MRDLEIRGAGNLLGVKQSGHIAALGFDLYCQLLAEAVEELKASRKISPEGRGIGEGATKKGPIIGEEKESPSIVLPLDAHIPEEYVPNLSTRLSLYHRLGELEHIAQVADIARELRDRFGTPPEPVENLLYIVKIKILATGAEVSSISTQGRHIVIKPQATGSPLRARGVGGAMNKYPDGAIKIGPTQIKLDTRLLGGSWKAVLGKILSSNWV
jgi:transcription-repair coupling factor (superfamily II helicase)